MRVIADDEDVTVYRAERGSDNMMAEVLSTDQATVTTTARLQFNIGTDSYFRIDDIMAISDDLSTTYAYNYDDANELLTMTVGPAETIFQYDDWGRTITKTLGNMEAVYKYRYGHKVKRVDTDFFDEQTTAFLYDGLGKLRSIGDGTDPIDWLRWDTGWNVLGSYQDGDGDWDIGDLEAVFLSRGGVPLGLRVPITAELDLWFYYYHDHLGSTRHLRMDDKSAAAEYQYTPYGDTYLAHGSDQAFRYTGKPRDSRTGLYHFPYRFYNPTFADGFAPDVSIGRQLLSPLPRNSQRIQAVRVISNRRLASRSPCRRQDTPERGQEGLIRRLGPLRDRRGPIAG